MPSTDPQTTRRLTLALARALSLDRRCGARARQIGATGGDSGCRFIQQTQPEPQAPRQKLHGKAYTTRALRLGPPPARDHLSLVLLKNPGAIGYMKIHVTPPKRENETPCEPFLFLPVVINFSPFHQKNTLELSQVLHELTASLKGTDVAQPRERLRSVVVGYLVVSAAAEHGPRAPCQLRYAGAMLLGAHESVAGGPRFTAIPRAPSRMAAKTIQIFARPSAQWAHPGRSPPARVTRFFAPSARAAAWAGAVARLLPHQPVRDGSGNSRKNRAPPSRRSSRVPRSSGSNTSCFIRARHLGAGERDGIASVAESLDAVHERTRGMRVRLLLEGHGRFRAAASGVVSNRSRRCCRRAAAAAVDVGVCFDTCHVHASGYDLSTDEGYDRTLRGARPGVGHRPHQGVSTSTTRSHPARQPASTVHAEIGDGFLGPLPFWAPGQRPALSRACPACWRRRPGPRQANRRSSATWNACARWPEQPRPHPAAAQAGAP